MHRSALGIRRIKDVDVSQVLHATESDIQMLRHKLQSWGVSSFRSYPVLLRALTHPSISNWAERILDLPKRSLGPNTLELLGDRVVGTAAAFRALQWRKGETVDTTFYRGRPTGLVRSLVGNRGMAVVAADIGIDKLIRWEKGRPPVTHRERLSSAGVDEVTGLLSNVQINALASAYEAVAGAIYLDGGFTRAESFVNNTLLRDARSVQNVNVDVLEYEEMFLREVESMLGSVSFIASRRRAGRSGWEAIKSYEKVQCEMLDLECSAVYNQAHRMYYCGIAVRRMCDVGNEIREEDLLYMSSHFSVENARMAALMGALETLRGEKNAIGERRKKKNERLQMREIVFGSGAPGVDVGLREDGGWWLEGDYGHFARVLGAVGGGIGMGELGEFHVADVREVLRGRCEKRRDGGEEEMLVESGIFYGKSERLDGGFPRRVDVESGGVHGEYIEKYVEVGRVIEASRKLTMEHEGLREDIGTGDDISQAITNKLDIARALPVEERSLFLKSYHALGHQVMRLWSVQRSMSDIGDDRSAIIGHCEDRASLGQRFEKIMIADGMADIGDLRVKKVFVGLGMCVDSVGLGSALAWLTGADVALKDSFRKSCDSGSVE